MAMSKHISLVALLLSVTLTSYVRTANDETTLDNDDTTTETGYSNLEINSTTTQEQTLTATQPSFNLLNQKFLTQPLLVSDNVRNLAYATLEVAFGRWNSKNEVILCKYNHFQNKAATTKYKSANGVLNPIKSEEYQGPADGSPSSTKCVRKGRTARSTVAAQEGAARLFRATAKPEDMTQVSFVELYNNCIPLCMQADSAEQVTQFINYIQQALNDGAIDPSIRPRELKPLCVLIVSSDHLLRTVDNSQWEALQSIYNLTTMYDAPVRKYMLDVREALCEMVKVAGESKIDLNPSFIEGLFDDMNRENYDFNYKRIIREIISTVANVKFITGAITAILITQRDNILPYLGLKKPEAPKKA